MFNPTKLMWRLSIATRWFLNVPFDNVKRKRISEIIYRHCPPSRHTKVTEIGCGNGKFLAMMQKKGYVCVGVDLNKKQIQLNRQSYPLITWANGSYEYASSNDIVIFYNTLEYFTRTELKDMISELRKKSPLILIIHDVMDNKLPYVRGRVWCGLAFNHDYLSLFEDGAEMIHMDHDGHEINLIIKI